MSHSTLTTRAQGPVKVATSDQGSSLQLLMRLPEPPVMWILFVLAHLWIVMISRFGPTSVDGLSSNYLDWVNTTLTGGAKVGISIPWDLPALAFWPMVIAKWFSFGGSQNGFILVWLLLVVLANATAFYVLLKQSAQSWVRFAGIWWLLLIVALGPYAVTRVEAFTVPLMIVALIWLTSRPLISGILMTVALWIRFWPLMVITAVALAIKQRRLFLVPVYVGSLVIGFFLMLMGAGGNVFGFLGSYFSPTMRVDSSFALIWLWLRANGATDITVVSTADPVNAVLAVNGPGTTIVGLLAALFLVATITVLICLAVRALRFGRSFVDVVPSLALALVIAFLVFGRSGGPEYLVWLVAPVIFGLVVNGQRFFNRSLLVLGAAFATQIIFPFGVKFLAAADSTTNVGTLSMEILRYGLLFVVLFLSALELCRIGSDKFGTHSVLNPLEERSLKSVSSRFWWLVINIGRKVSDDDPIVPLVAKIAEPRIVNDASESLLPWQAIGDDSTSGVKVVNPKTARSWWLLLTRPEVIEQKAVTVESADTDVMDTDVVDTESTEMKTVTTTINPKTTVSKTTTKPASSKTPTKKAE